MTNQPNITLVEDLKTLLLGLGGFGVEHFEVFGTHLALAFKITSLFGNKRLKQALTKGDILATIFIKNTHNIIQGPTE